MRQGKYTVKDGKFVHEDDLVSAVQRAERSGALWGSVGLVVIMLLGAGFYYLVI